MYLCKCNNMEATLIVCMDSALPDPLYLYRTGKPTDSFVGSGIATTQEQQIAARSGPANDVVCPHCSTQCTWSVCSSCGSGGAALADVQPNGQVTCRDCSTEQTVDDLHIMPEDDEYFGM